MKARTSDRAPNRDDDRPLPLVWVLNGHRAGDNLQLQALADGLGWPAQIKTLTWQKPMPRWSPLYGRSAHLKHLTPDAKATFKPPWPDLVLSVGWRSVPVARWITAQYGARLVHVGRPRAPLDCFDLILTTPQYRLPAAGNVVRLNGPLTTLSHDELAASGQAWQPRLTHLPRPWTAVLVGGDAPTLKFPPAAAAALAAACNVHAQETKGSLLIATSPRTSDQVAEILCNAITAPTFFNRWEKDADNPYAAFLALADQFIVTNDSVSMTQEAALTGRPVSVFQLDSKEKWSDKVLLGMDHTLRSGRTALTGAYLGLLRQGILYPPKSPADYFNALVGNGHAKWLRNSSEIGGNPPMQSDNARAVQVVQALFDTGGAASS